MKCKWCDKEFESTRADARFCSDKCRKAAKRKADNVSEIRRKSDKVSEIIKADTATNGQEETDALIAEVVDDSYVLPPLPTDPVLACNQGITWADVLAMSREQIDYVYKAWRVIGDSLLLRLKRAAGYHQRVAA